MGRRIGGPGLARGSVTTARARAPAENSVGVLVVHVVRRDGLLMSVKNLAIPPHDDVPPRCSAVDNEEVQPLGRGPEKLGALFPLERLNRNVVPPRNRGALASSALDGPERKRGGAVCRTAPRSRPAVRRFWIARAARLPSFRRRAPRSAVPFALTNDSSRTGSRRSSVPRPAYSGTHSSDSVRMSCGLVNRRCASGGSPLLTAEKGCMDKWPATP